MTAGTEHQSEKPAGAPIENHFPSDTIYHYSRERRLRRASADVQALNEGKLFPKTGFFSNKSHRLILFVVLFTLAAAGLSSRFVGEGGGQQYQGMRLGGNALALAILPVEETLFLVIVKNTPETGEFFTGAVDIAVSPVAAAGDTPEVFSQRIFFNLVESESFQISLPFEGTDFFVVLNTGEEQRALRLRVE